MNRSQFRELIVEVVNKTFSNVLKEKLQNVSVNYPKEEKHGHYATSIALELTKVVGSNPRDIAHQIKEQLEVFEKFKKIEIAGPGFINVFLHRRLISQSLLDIKNSKDRKKLKKKRVLLEYISANPTGPLHIGHGRWAAVGDSLARILTYYGYEVSREFYVNNKGIQIDLLRQTALAIKSSQSIPEGGYQGQYMQIFKDIDEDPVEYFMSDHKRALEKMNVDIDFFCKETDLHEGGKIEEAIRIAREKEVIYEKDGATWFKTEQYGDEKDRVIIKKDGVKTYFLSDVAYHRDKVARGYDILVDILGADHHGYVKRLESIIAVYAEKKVEFSIVIGQLVNLFRSGKAVRMSKRTGDMITLEEVLDEIGSDGVRYFLTMRSMNSTLDFDMDMAKEKTSENPVYYIQYAHARIHSVFRKAEEKGIKVGENDFDYHQIESSLVDQLSIYLIRFEDVIEDIVKIYQPYLMCNYLYQLSSLFHKYYLETKFIHDNDKEKSIQYLIFLQIIQKILNRGLTLIGIQAPEKM